jgi:hypothetical protein
MREAGGVVVPEKSTAFDSIRRELEGSRLAGKCDLLADHQNYRRHDHDCQRSHECPESEFGSLSQLAIDLVGPLQPAL